MKCLQCSKTFKAKRADAKTCSPKCRVAYNRSVTDKKLSVTPVTDNLVTDNLSVTDVTNDIVTDKEDKTETDRKMYNSASPVTVENAPHIARQLTASKKPFWSNLDKKWK